MKYIYKTISELGKVVTGKTPPTENEEYYDGEYPFITPSDIHSYDEKYLASTERTVSDIGAKILKGMCLPSKSICFVCIGSTIGKMCMTNVRSYSNQQINSLIPNKEYDNDYLFYYLRYIKSYFQSIGGGTGSGKGIVNKTLFSKTKIRILDDKILQQRLAHILSTYDKAIEINNKRIKVLEQMAENLYKEWFVRFRFPGYENAEFENGIPEGWHILRLQNFCYITDGTHDTPQPVENGIPLVTGKLIDNGEINYDNAYMISEADHVKIKKRSELTTGDILFSNIGTVGKCCIVNYEREFSVKNVIIFKPNSYLKSFYLYYWLISDSMQELFSTQTNGASQQFVGLNFMRNYRILVPSQKVLSQFGNYLKTIYGIQNTLRDENKNLIKQRDLLLPRLMGGKLEV